MPDFEIVSEFQPRGDQPAAIAGLTEAFRAEGAPPLRRYEIQVEEGHTQHH